MLPDTEVIDDCEQPCGFENQTEAPERGANLLTSETSPVFYTYKPKESHESMEGRKCYQLTLQGHLDRFFKKNAKK